MVDSALTPVASPATVYFANDTTAVKFYEDKHIHIRPLCFVTGTLVRTNCHHRRIAHIFREIDVYNEVYMGLVHTGAVRVPLFEEGQWGHGIRREGAVTGIFCRSYV